MKLPTLEEAEEAIGIPADKWAGRCYEIASAFVKAGIVVGKPRYGHFVGKVSPDGYFGSRSNHSFVRHGWIDIGDDEVVDPTRFAFENKSPYIYCGCNSGEYDIGGNIFRALMTRPCPEYNKGEAQKKLTFTDSEALLWVTYQLDIDFNRAENMSVTTSMGQLFWLGNLSLDSFNGHERDIYQALINAGLEAIIPLDNRDYVFYEENVLT